MSFFENLGLESAVVSDESANIDSGGFPLINGGTNSIALIHNVKWMDGYNGAEGYIQFMFKLTDTSFKDCFARCKIRINDNDPKRRQKAANLFSRFYALCGVQPPAHLPNDSDLAQFKGKMLGVEVGYWIIQDPETNVWSDGNWIGSIFEPAGFVSFDGKIEPQDIAKLNSQAVPPQANMQAPVQQPAQQPMQQPQQAMQQPAQQPQQPAQQPMQQAAGWGN